MRFGDEYMLHTNELLNEGLSEAAQEGKSLSCFSCSAHFHLCKCIFL